MTARLIFAIFSTLLEETALVVIVLWGLPELEIHIPLAGLIALMAAWGAYSVVSYRIGSRALRRKAVIGLPAMVGARGKVVSPLAPNGLVIIKGELWGATSSGTNVDVGEEVVVVEQDGLRLVVDKNGSDNSTGTG